MVGLTVINPEIECITLCQARDCPPSHRASRSLLDAMRKHTAWHCRPTCMWTTWLEICYMIILIVIRILSQNIFKIWISMQTISNTSKCEINFAMRHSQYPTWIYIINNNYFCPALMLKYVKVFCANLLFWRQFSIHTQIFLTLAIYIAYLFSFWFALRVV